MPDEATDLMATILGGGFSSRINMNIREDKGYAYGARGGFRYNRYGSMLVAGGSVKSDVTKESIQEILKELHAIRDADVTDEELGRENPGAILALPAQFATGRAVQSTDQNLLYHGLPLGYYDTFVRNVQGLTKAAVRKAALGHVKPADVRLLVVGDGRAVLPRLRELLDAKELVGELVVLDADGKAVGGR